MDQRDITIGVMVLLGASAAIAIGRLSQSLLHLQLVHAGRERPSAAPFVRAYLIQGVAALVGTAMLLVLVVAMRDWRAGLTAADGFVLPSASMAGFFASIALLPDGHGRSERALRAWPHAGRFAVGLFTGSMVAVVGGTIAIAKLPLPDPVFALSDLPTLLAALTCFDLAVVFAVRRSSMEVMPGLGLLTADEFRRHTNEAMLYLAAGVEVALLAAVLAWSSPSSMFGQESAQLAASIGWSPAITAAEYVAMAVAVIAVVLAIRSCLSLLRLHRDAVRARSAAAPPIVEQATAA